MQPVSYPVVGNQCVLLAPPPSCASPPKPALTPLGPLLARSDVAPVNAFPRSTSPQASASDWVFDLAARDWEKWIGRRAAEQVRTTSGCYSRVHPGTDLKIISLNTNYWCVPLSRLDQLGEREADAVRRAGTSRTVRRPPPLVFSTAALTRLPPRSLALRLGRADLGPERHTVVARRRARPGRARRAARVDQCVLPLSPSHFSLPRADSTPSCTQSGTCRSARSTRCATRATTPTRSFSATTTRSPPTSTATGASRSLLPLVLAHELTLSAPLRQPRRRVRDLVPGLRQPHGRQRQRDRLHLGRLDADERQPGLPRVRHRPGHVRGHGLCPSLQCVLVVVGVVAPARSS